jgi:mono/diheme cytochrome c family protein
VKRIVVVTLAGIANVSVLVFSSPRLAAGADGKAVYAMSCAACHGSTGQGAERAGPPLAHNVYVTGDVRKVIHTINAGMTGPIKFNGRPWGSGTMPPWKKSLSNAQIANVINHIRTSWGNNASRVTENQVAAIK